MHSDDAATAIVSMMYAATVKLLEFWQHDLALWFLHSEAQFHLCGITTEVTKYYHVVAALETSTTRQMIGFLREPADGKTVAGVPVVKFVEKRASIVSQWIGGQ